jgi:hypothetical protein
MSKDRGGQGEPANGGVPTERRLELLEGVLALACLPTPALEELAEHLEEDSYPSGAKVVAEGEVGDRLYLIADGHAEVSTAGQDSPVPLAALGPGSSSARSSCSNPAAGVRRR